MSKARRLVALVAMCLALPVGLAAPAWAADADSGTPEYALYQGTLAAGEEGTVAFSTSADEFTTGADGHVTVGFSLRAASDSALDPALIRVRTVDGTPTDVSGTHHADTNGGTSSATLAQLTVPGSYQALVRGSEGTAGGYELTMYLAGDVNGDFQVGADDLAAIDALSGAKYGDPAYTVWADVDRNGVINGGDEQRAADNLGASTTLRLTADNPLDQFLPPDALTLSSVSESGFNAVSAPLTFDLTGDEFFDDPAQVSLTVNGRKIPSGSITVAPSRITATSALTEGRNVIQFAGVDTIGRPLYHTATVWAGYTSLRVDVVDAGGAPVTDAVTVRVTLTDDQDVYAESTTSTGTAVFGNLPARTVLVKATASGNRLGTVGLFAGDGYTRVRLLGFGTPSTVDNNDFSQGTAGWNIGTAPVVIGPHVEGIPGYYAATAPKSAPLAPTPDSNPPTDERPAPPMAPAQPGASLAPDASSSTSGGFDAASLADNDMTVWTSGEGEQSVSRTFTTDPDVTSIRLRYRFITAEVPGGYYGSRWNDYFRVSLRSESGGGSAGEANSMNGLGLGAFDYGSGATAWRDVTLPVDKAGDTIQVDLGIANVGDGLYDSRVVVDFVGEDRDQVQPSLAWDSTNGGLKLTYTVLNNDLKDDATIDVYWANGPGYANRTGSPIFSQTVPKGTTVGDHGPIHIAGNLLANDPAGVTHLIATSSPSKVGAVPDVRVGFGANANAATVWASTLDAVKDGLRAAGQPSATISSTARTAADQARAMFNNLVNPAHTLAQNIASQHALYAAPGDAVINVFAQQTQGMTLAQVNANAAAIQAAMVAEINHQGPQNVSRHCADPTVVNVIDIGSGVFNTHNGPLFVASVSARASRFIDERANNHCYHFEFTR